MIISEDKLFRYLDTTKNALLIEPSCKVKHSLSYGEKGNLKKGIRRYLPLGLAKIAGYLKSKGIQYDFSRSIVSEKQYDSIYITSLFIEDYQMLLKEIRNAKSEYSDSRIIVGGISATLLKDDLLNRVPYIELFTGYSRRLEQVIPDHETNWHLIKPFDEFSYIFATRGCYKKCPYCMVKHLEEDWYNPNWKNSVDMNKPNIMVCDNNLTSHLEIHTVLNELYLLKKKVRFDHGLEVILITPEIAHQLAKLNIMSYGLVISFDRIEDNGKFQSSLSSLMRIIKTRTTFTCYVLFNFNDTPQDAHYRMKEVWKLKVVPYPQRFQPASLNNIEFIGKHWTANLIKAFRQYWIPGQFATFYKKMTFEKFVTSKYCKIRLTSEDWDKWYAK